MIAKHVPMRSSGKSDFAGLVKYVTDAQGRDHRLGSVHIANCDAVSVQDAITEVLATQRTNTRAKGDKTYHLIVSFRAGEQPGADTLRGIEERICAGLGYDEHQRISAVHTDTDNLHVHIAINKIHPIRLTMHEPYYPHRVLAELCATLEQEYGLERDNHVARRRGAESRASDMERHAGIDSLVGWIKRECLEQIREAQSWQDLHQVMNVNGLTLRERANGFVIEASNGVRVKASTVARYLSKPNLEAKLGPFDAPPAGQGRIKARHQYQKDPICLPVSTSELYARYKAEQQTAAETKKQALAQARHRKEGLIEEAKRSARLRRAAIKLLGGNRIRKKLLYAQAHKALSDTIQRIQKQYQEERKASYAAHVRCTWADWLRKEAVQGDDKALLALRRREAAQGLKGNTIQGQGEVVPAPVLVTDNITKKGTIILRAGAFAIRDDGEKLQVSRETTPEGLKAALQSALTRYGGNITVNGSVEFKAQIVLAAVNSALPIKFTDPALESRRLALLKKEPIIYEQPNRKHVYRSSQRSTAYRGRAGRGLGRTEHGTLAYGVNSQSEPGRNAVYSKPHVGILGRIPPPQSQHRLRTLSELGVVRIASGGEVLLQGDVSRHMEQSGTQPAHSLRRNVFESGDGVATAISPGLTAADKYIAEREGKRAKGFDIQKHKRYTVGEGSLIFQGVRDVDGQRLVLLKRDGEIMVMPVDQATAQRLSRTKVGADVSVTLKGSIKTTKGRSR